MAEFAAAKALAWMLGEPDDVTDLLFSKSDSEHLVGFIRQWPDVSPETLAVEFARRRGRLSGPPMNAQGRVVFQVFHAVARPLIAYEAARAAEDVPADPDVPVAVPRERLAMTPEPGPYDPSPRFAR